MNHLSKLNDIKTKLVQDSTSKKFRDELRDLHREIKKKSIDMGFIEGCSVRPPMIFKPIQMQHLLFLSSDSKR